MMKFSGSRSYVGLFLLVALLLGLAGVWWGYAHLTGLVQARLTALAGSDVSVEKVTARWNRVELDQVRIARHGNGPFTSRFSCNRIVISPSLLSLLSGRLDIKEILFERPYLLFEINPSGSVARILPARPAVASGSSSPLLPVRIAATRFNNGSIDLLDWQVARKAVTGISNPREHYHLTKLQDVTFSAGAFAIPATEQPVPLRLELGSKGGGHLLIAGDIAPKGLDTHLKIDLTALNIMPYRPYFQKRGDLEVSAGTLSASSTFTINKRILKAPGALHLKGLSFDHSSTKGVLLGVPSWALIAFLSDNKNELSVQFSLDGNLDNPLFSIHQSLSNQIATALSSKIGVPTVSGVGKGILEIGEKSIKGIFGITGTKK